MVFPKYSVSQISYKGEKNWSLGILDYHIPESDRKLILEKFVNDARRNPSFDSLYDIISVKVSNFSKKFNEYTILELGTDPPKDILQIFNEIDSLKKEDKKPWKMPHIKKMADRIYTLPLGKEKIWLILKYGDLLLSRQTPFPDLTNIIKELSDSIAFIPNDIDKALSYRYIGNFVASKHDLISAIDYYYLASRIAYNSNSDSCAKLTTIGLLNQDIADLFYQNQTNFALTKSAHYHMTASLYYDAAKDTFRSQRSIMKFISIYSSALFRPGLFSNDIITRNKYEGSLLNVLFNWYSEFLKNPISNNISLLALISVSNILYGEKHIKEARTYMQLALLMALEDNELDLVIRCLSDISMYYAMENNRIEGLRYAKLISHLAPEQQRPLIKYKSLLATANVHLLLKEFHLAVSLCNKLTSGLKLNDMYDVVPYMHIVEAAWSIKSNSLGVLKKDSLSYYKLQYESTRRLHEIDLAKLLMKETECLLNWLNIVKSKELESERTTKELMALTSRNEKKTIIAISITILIALFFTFYIYRQNAKLKITQSSAREKELNFLKDQSENETTIARLKLQIQRGKQHEIANLIEQVSIIQKMEFLKVQLSKKTLSDEFTGFITKIFIPTKKISDYINNIYNLSKEETTSLFTQYNLAKEFASIFEFEIEKPDLIRVENHVTDEFVNNRLPIPTHFLNIFLMNAVQYGLRDDRIQHLSIGIYHKAVGPDHIIEIDDNGCGINKTRLNQNMGHNNTGFTLAAAMINEYNKNKYGFKIHPNFTVIDKSEIGLGSGTLVSIVFQKSTDGN